MQMGQGQNQGQNQGISQGAQQQAMQGVMGQGQQQTQQARMMTPPQVVTTKDLMYLKDAMSWTLLSMKKAAHFAQESTDPQIKQSLDRVGQIHARHYTMLLKHAQNNNSAAMANIPQQQSH